LAVVCVDTCKEDVNLSGGGSAVVAVEDGEECGRVGGRGVTQGAAEFGGGRCIVIIANVMEFWRERIEEHSECTVERLEGRQGLIVGLFDGHGAGVGISQAAEAVAEGLSVIVLDGIAELLEFAECGAVGGESLEVIG
jgi:hypothetical protein